MTERKRSGTPGDKSICLPVADDIEYASLVEDRERYRVYFDEQIAEHPELFPVDISDNYRFHGNLSASRD